MKRTYVHDKCGSKTRVDGFDLYRLANPFFFIIASTRCGNCGGVTINTTRWDGHDQSMWRHRARLRRRRFWVWFFWPAFIAIGAYIGYRLLPLLLPNIHDPQMFGATVGIGVGIVAGYVLVPLIYHVSNGRHPVDDIPNVDS